MTPRGLGKRAAATYCGMPLVLFEEQVKLGHLPKPWRLKKQNKVYRIWDRKALDDSLDALSGRYHRRPLKEIQDDLARRVHERTNEIRRPAP